MAEITPEVVSGRPAVASAFARRPALENRTTLARFLGEPFVVTLPPTAEVARRYGKIFARLRREGTPIPTNNIWIAATTIDAGAQLLTFDPHFQHVQDLDCTLLDG